MRLPFRPTPTDEAGGALVGRIDLLIEAQRQTNDLLERLIALEASLSGSPDTGEAMATVATSGSKRRTRVAPGGRATKKKPKPATERSPRLHDEIEAVLREAAQPLSANIIADRIRERGQYSPPRSAKPLSGSNVNSRVANRTYRNRFVRQSEGIWLAEPEDESGGI